MINIYTLYNQSVERLKNCKGRVGYPWILGQVNINAHDIYHGFIQTYNSESTSGSGRRKSI